MDVSAGSINTGYVPVPTSSSAPRRCTCSCSLKDGEACCFAGPCLQLPCCDRYAPNNVGCCCCAPQYDEEVFPFDEFFNKVLPRLHTGDVILCSWPLSSLGTQVSRCMAHTRWSHVGLVYRPSDDPDILLTRDRYFSEEVHESRPLMLHTTVAGEMGPRMDEDNPLYDRGGTDLVDLEVLIKDYLDKFSHCPLGDAEDVSQIGLHFVGVRFLKNVVRDKAFYTSFQEVVQRYFNTGFKKTMDANVMSSQIDACPLCIGAEKDTSKLFCSVLAAEVYRGTGLVADTLNPNEFLPAMFDTTRRLRLLNGAAFSQEHVVYGPATLEERRNFGFPDMEDAKKRYPTSFKQFGSGGFFKVDVTRPCPILAAESDAFPEQMKMNT